MIIWLWDHGWKIDNVWNNDLDVVRSFWISSVCIVAKIERLFEIQRWQCWYIPLYNMLIAVHWNQTSLHYFSFSLASRSIGGTLPKASLPRTYSGWNRLTLQALPDELLRVQTCVFLPALRSTAAVKQAHQICQIQPGDSLQLILLRIEPKDW